MYSLLKPFARRAPTAPQAVDPSDSTPKGRSVCLSVAPTRCVVLNNVQGSTLMCTAGRLWVSEDGRYGDHDVLVGNKLRLTRRGKTLVSSGAPSTFLLVAAPVGALSWQGLARFAADVMHRLPIKTAERPWSGPADGPLAHRSPDVSEQSP